MTAVYTTKNGIERTAAQIEAAFEVCRQLTIANEKAAPDNGGGSGIDWSDLDDVWALSQLALSPLECAACVNLAREYNDYGG